MEINSGDAALRRDAAKLLGSSGNPQAKQIIGKLLEKHPDGSFIEADAGVREEATKALRAIERGSLMPQIAAMLFSGLSLGSVFYLLPSVWRLLLA